MQAVVGIFIFCNCSFSMSKAVKHTTKAPVNSATKQPETDASLSDDSGEDDSSSMCSDEAYTASRAHLASKLQHEASTFKKVLKTKAKYWKKLVQVGPMISSLHRKKIRKRQKAKTNAMQIYRGYGCPFCPWYGVRKGPQAKRYLFRHVCHTHADVK